ncbi:MAG: MFS transporter [SAR324 cluster bacterium]|nr:MFS transporter [SAR324 cluster bacterium]
MSNRPIWQLATAEIFVWAGTLYLFPALILRWESDLGWSKTELSAAYTTALIVSALAAPLAGHLIDRGFGRAVLVGSALLAGVIIGAVGLIEQYWLFFVAWLGLGLAMAGCLYEPCFAFVTRIRGEEAKRSITLITLVAGFAGTASFPTANLVADFVGWRGSTTTFALLILLVAVPLFWLATAEDQPGAAPAGPNPQAAPERPLQSAMAKPEFWLLTSAFTAIAVGHGFLISHLLPLLAERDVPSGLAVLAASLIGPMQVVGRLVMMFSEKHVSMNTVCATTFVCISAGVVALMFAGASPELVFVFVAVHGAGYGVTSITRPVVTANLLGREGFGAISGAMAVGFMGGFALAPVLAAQLWQWGGYDLVLEIALGTSLFGLFSFLLALFSVREKDAQPPT